MPCFHPREVKVNKPRITYKWIQMPDGSIKRERDSKGKPIVLGVASWYFIQVPCGKCRWCLALQQSQWSFRIEQEVLHGGYAQSLFVTLTYAPEFLPDDAGLYKSEVQKYLHDLRQNLYRRYSCNGTDKEAVPKVSYYICGEYGSRFGRPHFHCILMFTKSVDWRIIQKSWSKGIVDIREFTPARAGYVAKYSVKDLSLDYAGRPAPFHLQSKGLGSAFLKVRSSFASLQYNTYFANSSGRKVKLPRYYLDKLGITRKYYDYEVEGVKFRRSSSYHSFSYDYTNELARINFLNRESMALSLSGLSYSEFLQQRSMESQKLEHELENLYRKTSSYYVLSRLESSALQKSV